MRAMTSGAPPAPVVTISLTGAVGKFCAGAGVAVTAASNTRAQSRRMSVSYCLIAFAVSAITGRQICCCSRMKAVSSSGVVTRM